MAVVSLRYHGECLAIDSTARSFQRAPKGPAHTLQMEHPAPAFTVADRLCLPSRGGGWWRLSEIHSGRPVDRNRRHPASSAVFEETSVDTPGFMLPLSEHAWQERSDESVLTGASDAHLGVHSSEGWNGGSPPRTPLPQVPCPRRTGDRLDPICLSVAEHPHPVCEALQ